MLSDLLDKTKGFTYQITLKNKLKKYKPNEEIKFTPVYFNSTTKTLINHKFSLENAFQKILNKINTWINEGSGWIVELSESHSINILTYRPLSGSSNIKLPADLKSSKKGLIKIKNKDQKCFSWCHVRLINPVKIHPERITWEDEELVNDIIYDTGEFPVREKYFGKTETKNSININVPFYENKLVFPIYVSDQTFKNSMICYL